MDRRVFVVDAAADADTLIMLALWAVQHEGSFTTEPIISGVFETSFVTATLEYPHGTVLPEFPEYTPFSMLVTLGGDEFYTDGQRDVDCAILSAYTGLPIDTVNKTESSAGMEIAFFLGGTPLWIDPHEWGLYTKLIAGTKDMRLVSSNPVFVIALAIADHQEIKHPSIIKHPDLDVWYTADTGDDVHGLFVPYLRHLDDVMAISLPIEDSTARHVLDEIIAAYEYKHYTFKGATLNLPTDKYYLIGVAPFTAEWLGGAYEQVMNGNIPFVTVTMPEIKVPMAAVRHNFIQAYLHTLQVRGCTYITPSILDAITVDQVEDIMEITFMIDSRSTMDAIFTNMKPINTIHTAFAVDVEQGLKLRYRLSLLGIASLLTPESTPTNTSWMVTWENGPNDVPRLSGNSPSLKQALLNYLSSAREGGDVVSGRDFPELTISELIEVIVTQWHNAYELDTITRLVRWDDPLNRQPLTPNELGRATFGRSGYFTVGPLLGLRSSIDDVMPRAIMPNDGVIVTSISNHIDETTVADGLETGAPIELKDVEFTVAMMNGVLLPLLTLIIPTGQVAEMTTLLTAAWQAGDFLSPWSRAYLCGQHVMSYVAPILPLQLQGLDNNPHGAERVLTYLKMLKSYHDQRKPTIS